MADRVGSLPEHLQLKILAMLAPPPGAPVSSTQRSRATAAEAPPAPIAADALERYSAWAHGLAARLVAHGIAWQDDVLPKNAAPSVLAAAQALPEDALAPAGMSASVARWRDASVRGDKIGWVPLAPAAAGTSTFGGLHAAAGWGELRAALSHIVNALNHSAAGRAEAEMLRLPEKVMLAHYPEGARYVRHSDVSAVMSHRRVTAIFYLNPDWEPSHGGELVLYPFADSASTTADPAAAVWSTTQPVDDQGNVVVAPRLGRLLLFDSHVEHEVCVTHRPRWAITAWLSIDRSSESESAVSSSAVSSSAVSSSAVSNSAVSSGAVSSGAVSSGAVPSGATASSADAATAGPTAPPSAPLPADEPVAVDARDAATVAPASQAAASASALTTTTLPDTARPLSRRIDCMPQHVACKLPRIFVSIASYRDPEAPHTLHNLFAQAAAPSRVIAGVCFQCSLEGDEDADCLDLSALRPEWMANVRELRVPWREARGPVWARFLIQTKLLGDEEYLLQIDSHTRFVPSWDAKLLAMLGRCPSPKPILTTYPLPYEGEGTAATLSRETRLTLLCTRSSAVRTEVAEGAQDGADCAQDGADVAEGAQSSADVAEGAQDSAMGAQYGADGAQDGAKGAQSSADGAFGADGMLRFRARLLEKAPTSPLPTAFWAAGFSFSSAALAREVPYDPYLPFLFFGEEIDVAVRLRALEGL